jgi:NAD+ kinase
VIVGLIANPVSSKDVRRLVGLARVVDVEEKANLVARLLAGLAAGPPVEVHALKDRSGLVERAVRLAHRHRPEIHWLPIEAEATESDTRRAAAALQELGAESLITVGGDGTVRSAVEGWPTAPLVPMSAGTNNAIALTEEPTVVGLATALATQPSVAERAFRRGIRLLVGPNGDIGTAVVDVVSVRTHWTGARALWEPNELVEAVISVARPTAVGLASVAAGLGPLEPGTARYVRFGPGTAVRAVFAPGLVLDIPVAEHRVVETGGSVGLGRDTRVVALDGERRTSPHSSPVVTVRDGPRFLDPTFALDAAS